MHSRVGSRELHGRTTYPPGQEHGWVRPGPQRQGTHSPCVRSTRTVGEQRGHMDQTDSTGLHNSTGQGGVGANAIPPPPPPNTHTHTRNTHTQLPQRPHPHTHTLAAHAVNTSEADALQPSLPRLNPIGLLCPTRAPTSTPV